MSEINAEIVASTVSWGTEHHALFPHLFSHTAGDGNAYARHNDSVPVEVPGTGSLPEWHGDALLTNSAYSVRNLEDEERLFDTRRFVTDIVSGQARALAQSTENAIAKWLDAQAIPSVWVGRRGVEQAVASAHTVLDGYGVGALGRFVVLGSALVGLLRPFSPPETDEFRLQESRIPVGVLEGPSPAFESWDIDRTVGYVFHQSAFAMRREAASLPGVGSVVRYASRSRGYRWLADYDASTLQDRSVIDTMFGLKLVKDDDHVKRVVKVQL